MFFHLAQTGLLDKLVKLFQEVDEKKGKLSQVTPGKRSREDDANENDEGDSFIHWSTVDNKKAQENKHDHGWCFKSNSLHYLSINAAQQTHK